MRSTRRAVNSVVSTPVVAAFVVLLVACAESPTSSNAVMRASTTSAAVDAATHAQFDGFICFGPSTRGDVRVTPGGTIHLRGFSNVNQWVGHNALIDGIEHNMVDANIDRDRSGVVHLDVSLQPDGMNGTWEIRQTLTIRNGVSAGGTGVGHGTGDLRGMTIKFTVGSAAPRPTGCRAGFRPFGPELHGIIISP